MAKTFNKLKVSNKIQETDDSCSFLLDLPEALSADYSFKSGQYLTIKVNIGGTEFRRAYSIFTAPNENNFGFTVKRVKGGRVSNFLIDKINSGSELEVMTPDGRFLAKPEVQAQKDHYFFAGGSGITPIISMITDLLENEPQSTCYLLYANRSEESIIFKDKLSTLGNNYANQFHYKHIISQPKLEKAGGLKGLFGKKAAPTWRGLKGRINDSILFNFFEEFPSKSKKDYYYLCGPSGLLTTVENYLSTQGVESSHIKKEIFTNKEQEKKSETAVAASGDVCQAEITLNGETFNLEIPKNKSILDAVIDLGKDPPYSCTSGACSTCVAKLTEGSADMEVCFALDDEEIEDGYILTCQAKCSSKTITLEFET